MMRVLTLAMSMPVSMMVVHTSTWASPSTICSMTEESCCSLIFPWPTTTFTSSPRSFWIREAVRSMDSTRLWR